MDSSSGAAAAVETPLNFADVIGIIFNNWTALKLSMEHGMAGPPMVSARKVQSMIEGVSEMLASGKAECYDIADFLIEMMDLDFSTILEDESSFQIAVHICNLYEIFRAGNIQELTTNIKSLPLQTPINATFQMQRLQPQAHDDIEDDEGDENPVQDDGWKLVKKR